jgi:TetR/AcrR family transcriptional regulator, transcriptional repressor for nem operon
MGRPRTFDEDEVLSAVSAAFREHGYAATSLGEIMQASGLGKGSIYATFGDKYAIFSRVFDRYCATVTQAMSDALAGPDESALKRLELVLNSAATRSGGSAAQRACFLAKTTAELGARDPAIAGRSRQAFTDLARSITGCIEQAQRAGDIDPRADAARLAHHVLAVLRGLEALAESGSDPSVLADAASVAVDLLRSPTLRLAASHESAGAAPHDPPRNALRRCCSARRGLGARPRFRAARWT